MSEKVRKTESERKTKRQNTQRKMFSEREVIENHIQRGEEQSEKNLLKMISYQLPYLVAYCFFPGPVEMPSLHNTDWKTQEYEDHQKVKVHIPSQVQLISITKQFHFEIV